MMLAKSKDCSLNSAQHFARCCLSVTLGGALVLTIWGCTHSPSQETYAVQGKVIVGKKLLTSGMIMFRTSDGHMVATEVSKDGTYQTQLAAGHHRVAFQITSELEPGKSARDQFRTVFRKSSIPSKYLYFESSGLNVDVNPKTANTKDIVLKLRK